MSSPEVIFPKGHPNNPMSPAELEAKFSACSRGRLPSSLQEKIIGQVGKLEKLASVADLMQMLAVGDAGTSQT